MRTLLSLPSKVGLRHGYERPARLEINVLRDGSLTISEPLRTVIFLDKEDAKKIRDTLDSWLQATK